MPAARPPQGAPRPTSGRFFVDLAFKLSPQPEAKPESYLLVGYVAYKGGRKVTASARSIPLTDELSLDLLQCVTASPVMGYKFHRQLMGLIKKPFTDETRQQARQLAESAISEINALVNVLNAGRDKAGRSRPGLAKAIPVLNGIARAMSKMRQMASSETPGRAMEAKLIGTIANLMRSPQAVVDARSAIEQQIDREGLLPVAPDLPSIKPSDTKFYEKLNKLISRDLASFAGDEFLGISRDLSALASLGKEITNQRIVNVEAAKKLALVLDDDLFDIGLGILGSGGVRRLSKADRAAIERAIAQQAKAAEREGEQEGDKASVGLIEGATERPPASSGKAPREDRVRPPAGSTATSPEEVAPGAQPEAPQETAAPAQTPRYPSTPDALEESALKAPREDRVRPPAGSTATSPEEAALGAQPEAPQETPAPARTPRHRYAPKALEELALSAIGAPGPQPQAAPQRRVVRVSRSFLDRLVESEAGRQVLNRVLREKGFQEIEFGGGQPQQPVPGQTAPQPSAAEPAATPRSKWTGPLIGAAAGYLLNPAINAILRYVGVLPPETEEEEGRVILTPEVPQDLFGGQPISTGQSLIYPGIYSPPQQRYMYPYPPYSPEWYNALLRSTFGQ